MAEDKKRQSGRQKPGSEMTREELIAFARSYVYRPEDEEETGKRSKEKRGTEKSNEKDTVRTGGRGRSDSKKADSPKKSEKMSERHGRNDYQDKDRNRVKGTDRRRDDRKEGRRFEGGRPDGAGNKAKAAAWKMPQADGKKARYVDEEIARRRDSFFDPEGDRVAYTSDRPLRNRDLPPIDESLPQCPVHKRCGGCTFIGRSYEASLEIKRKRVEKLLAPYGKLAGIVGMEDPYHYRNKVHAVYAHVKDGKKERNIAGIYEAGTHKVVPVTSCLIENEEADAIIQDILDLAKSFKIKIYDEDTGYGLLRHVLVRTAHVTGQIMVVLVLSSPVLPGKNNFVKALLERHPGITTILINVNDAQTSMVLGERETVLYGQGYIEDELCGNRFRISSKSFYQVNSVQTEKLYRRAVKMANLTGRERVIDAYCGIGTIGITAAAKAGEVIGVELNPDAVRDAIRNAKANKVSNIYFYENDAGDFLKGMAAQREKAEVIFMDPPRSGSTEKFMDAAAAMSPGRIIYISCGPDTLARDLAYLREKGYKLKEAWAYDMFPFTEHVETVCLLTHS